MTDITVRPNGSIVLFTPESDDGRSWIDTHLETEGWQWLGRSLAVDGRSAVPIYEGMLGDGLEVEVVS